MKTMIAVVALIAMIGAGIAGAVDVRETSWGVPFLPADPSLKTTDAFYGARGATLIGQDYQLPAVLTGQMDRNATAKRSIFDDDPWMDTLGGRSSEATVLNLAGAGELEDSQIDRLYDGQIPEAMPWM